MLALILIIRFVLEKIHQGICLYWGEESPLILGGVGSPLKSN